MSARLVLVCAGPTRATRQLRFPVDESLDAAAVAAVGRLAPALGRAGSSAGGVGDAGRVGDARGAGDVGGAGGAGGRFASAWCAPSSSARQTAGLLGLSAVEVPALADLGVGRWAGRSVADIAESEPATLRAWMTDPAAASHGGESVLDLLSRAGAWLAQVVEPSGRIVAVTHAAVIRAVVVAAIRATPDTYFRLDVSPLSLVELGYGDARWNLRSFRSAG